MENEEIKIGTPVIYWSIIEENGERSNPYKTEIISPSWELGHGEIVCKIKGKSGAVSIKYLDKITPGSLLAAQFKGCKDISDENFENETLKFFEERGIKINLQ